MHTPFPAPLTPLGARTPHAHPALPGFIVGLGIVILAATYLVWADFGGHWPYGTGPADELPTPTPATSPLTSVEYRNEQFGLLVTLPTSWEGYRDVGEEGEGAAWHGIDVATNMEIQGGPMVILRHPSSSDAHPRQDIPIMVFTPQQWAGLVAEQFSVGAAPIPPSILASNSAYVFALPARYNYAFPDGFEDVDRLIRAGAVSAFEPAR